MKNVIKEGVKVLVKRPGVHNEKGIVKKVIEYDIDTVLIVELESGKVTKAFITDVTVIQEEEKPDEITISREEFSEIAFEVINEESKKHGNVILSFAFAMVMSKLEARLFGDPDND